MLKGISDDINAIIEWELAHGNSIEGVYNALGVPVVSFFRPVRRWYEDAPREVPASLKLYEFRSQHYSEEQWRAGFESS